MAAKPAKGEISPSAGLGCMKGAFGLRSPDTNAGSQTYTQLREQLLYVDHRATIDVASIS
jgi:hypothetical protein